MKIVIAPDSFKDSLSAEGVAAAIAQGLADVLPQAQLVECPMADGGEGTMEALVAACAGEQRTLQVSGPLGEPVQARWGWLADSRTAIIEMAEASGLQLVPLGQRDACDDFHPHFLELGDLRGEVITQGQFAVGGIAEVRIVLRPACDLDIQRPDQRDVHLGRDDRHGQFGIGRIDGAVALGVRVQRRVDEVAVDGARGAGDGDDQPPGCGGHHA